MQAGISIIIPTYNGGRIFSDCLEVLGRQAYDGQIQLVIVDSGSTDGTIGAAIRAGALVKEVEKSAFHHARTRNMAVSLASFDQIVFMVQDTIPCSDGWLSSLAHGLEKDGVAAAFAAQIPHVDATPYARFITDSVATARLEASIPFGIQSVEAFQKMPYDQAYRSVGLDNVCAIYRKELLEKTPFPDVDFAEDMAWAVQISLQGYGVLYLPHVQVRHSHNRSPDYAFRRQIVNSYWVARIMGRVREDFSYLSLTDMIFVTRSVDTLLMRMIQEDWHGIQPFDGRSLFVDRLLRRYPFTERIRSKSCRSFFSGYWKRPSLRGKEVALNAGADIASQMAFIEQKYPPRNGKEWFETMEQVVANILGRLHGETYAARMLKGQIPHKLQNFIRPFLSGV